LFEEVCAVPIYEYKCSKCNEVFEAFQKISDLPLTECKFCGSKVEQLISQTSFQLKGSGWYLTDYAKKSSSPASNDAHKTTSSGNKDAGKESSGTTTTSSAPKSEKAPG
jgi:putative FmdB family regulatory protein